MYLEGLDNIFWGNLFDSFFLGGGGGGVFFFGGLMLMIAGWEGYYG